MIVELSNNVVSELIKTTFDSFKKSQAWKDPAVVDRTL